MFVISDGARQEQAARAAVAATARVPITSRDQRYERPFAIGGRRLRRTCAVRGAQVYAMTVCGPTPTAPLVYNKRRPCSVPHASSASSDFDKHIAMAKDDMPMRDLHRRDDGTYCAHGGSSDAYTGPRIPSIVILIVTPMFGALFPVVARRVQWLRALVPTAAFQVARYFGSGVIVR
ncbi:hypothetical protein WOLCODRAFT_154153 [Wolfiporia cocos MD-104 SS10]|uniref:Uncharacterized protein n=1 Tax=Wolfiporia cocos (strain MD-104) TaxID=742152 RepID=A0A2H3JPK6_WOLCO|nr:hypothetical protein WOLCODRAFT_154153 [Wolfiporia cocos MD-104 SS10]